MASLLLGELAHNGKKSSPCGQVELWNTPQRSEVKALVPTPQEEASLVQATDEVQLGAGDVEGELSEAEVNCVAGHVTMTKIASPGRGQISRGLQKWLFLLILYMSFTSVCATPDCSRVEIPFFYLVLRFQLGDECQEKPKDTIFSADPSIFNNDTLYYELFFYIILPLLTGIALEEMTRRPPAVQVPPPVPAPRPPTLRLRM